MTMLTEGGIAKVAQVIRTAVRPRDERQRFSSAR